MASLQKNVASQNFTFVLINATSGAGVSGATVTVGVTKDGGTQTAGTGTVTSQGSGQYNYAPATAETNATDVGFLFTATNCIPCNLDFHTDQVDANGFLKIDLVDIAGSAVNTGSAQLGVNVVNIAGAAVSAGVAQVGANVVQINSSGTAASNVSFANVAIGRGTCTAGGSTTSIVTSAFTPATSGTVVGQFIGRTVIFDATTTTVSLQGQATNITNSTSGATPTFTVTALTTAPANLDTFSVV